MRTLENDKYKVVFNSDNEFKVFNKTFGDVYGGTMENGKAIAKSAVGLAQIKRARKQLNF